MILAKKANRVLEIAPEKVKEYKELGYTIVQDGKEIYKPETNSKELEAKLEKTQAAADKTIAELNAKIEEIETLNQRVAELEAAGSEKDKTIADLNAKIVESEKAVKKATSSSKAAK